MSVDGQPLPAAARVLIVRTGALGDIVHALPVLAALRAARPDVAVDWLVDARYAAVLALVEGLRTRVVVRARSSGESERRTAFRRGAGHGVGAGLAARQRYDAALDLQGLIKSAALARGSGARRVVGFVTPQLRERHAAWGYTETVAGPAEGHVVAKNLAVLPALGGAGAGRRRRFPGGWSRPPSAADVMATPAVARAGRFALLNPGRGLAQQALAAGAVRRAGGAARREVRAAERGHVGRRRAPAGRGRRGARRGARHGLAGDDAERPARPVAAGQPRGERRHRSAAPRRVGRRAARRAVRADAPRSATARGGPTTNRSRARRPASASTSGSASAAAPCIDDIGVDEVFAAVRAPAGDGARLIVVRHACPLPRRAGRR